MRIAFVLALALTLLAAPAAAQEAAAPPLTPEHLSRYGTVRLRQADASIALVRELASEQQARRAAGEAAMPPEVEGMRQRSRQHDEAMQRFEEASGLSAAEWRACERLFDDLGAERGGRLPAPGARPPGGGTGRVEDLVAGRLAPAGRAERARKSWGDALVNAATPWVARLEAKDLELRKAAAKLGPAVPYGGGVGPGPSPGGPPADPFAAPGQSQQPRGQPGPGGPPPAAAPRRADPYGAPVVPGGTAREPGGGARP